MMNKTRVVVGLSVVWGFIAILLLQATGLVNLSGEFALTMFGALAAGFGQVLNWYFGSSRGSEAKTEAMVNKLEKQT